MPRSPRWAWTQLPPAISFIATASQKPCGYELLKSKSSATAQIRALPLEQLEALADALLDFQGPAELSAWLATNA